MAVPSLVAGYGALTSALAFQITNLVPEPYMDEIFHIPQAQKYCKGSFKEWDDKITTLPGLYFMTVGVLNPISKWQNSWLCTTSTLRLVNVGFASLTLLVLHRITTQIHGDKHVSLLLHRKFCESDLYFTHISSTLIHLRQSCQH